MSEDTSERQPNLEGYDFHLPTPEQGLEEAKHRLALTLRRNEMALLAGETYDPTTPAWNIDVIRPGAMGRWVRQRSRFDEQAHVLYYLGETSLSDAEFRAARRTAPVFDIATWQDRPVY
jgi:hypothetical protein